MFPNMKHGIREPMNHGVLATLVTLGILGFLCGTNELRAMPLGNVPSRSVAEFGLTLVQDPRNFQQKIIVKTAYHTQSDTYFQLVKDVVIKTYTGKWPYAVMKAKRMEYKARRGRLAVIDTEELHRWVTNTFDFEKRKVWIGLRYWCRARMLAWANGDTHSSNAFGAWNAVWYRDSRSQCEKGQIQYMGVYYDGNTYRWRATGPAKEFPYYLVEYPPSVKEKRH